jgi:5,6,7,8-tetrahydromethanopterin hydro-lyase
MWQQILSFFKSQPEGDMSANFYLGESLVGDGNEIAHVDLITTLLAVVSPNLPCKPDTVLFNKVTIKGAKQAVQMFGPAQAAVARAVVDSVASGVIPKDKANDWCILVGVFIHWQAEDDKKIFKFNYEATKQSIERALKGQPTIDAVLTGAKTARHPFSGVDNA